MDRNATYRLNNTSRPLRLWRRGAGGRDLGAVRRAADATYERVGMRAGMLEQLAGVRERRWWPDRCELRRRRGHGGREGPGRGGHRPQSQIGVMINTSVSRAYLEPSSAVAVHHQLGLPASCLNFDLANACLGFVNAIQLAGTMIDAGQADYALLVDGEGSRYTQERALERLAQPTTRPPTTCASSSPRLTLGSGRRRWCSAGPTGTRRDIGWSAGSAGPAPNTTTSASATWTRMRTDTKRLFEAGLALAIATWRDAQADFDWADAGLLHRPPDLGGAHQRDGQGAPGRRSQVPADPAHLRQHRARPRYRSRWPSSWTTCAPACR